eukprot:g10421.t1
MEDTPDVAAMADDLDQLTRSLDFAWLFVCMVLVVVMQSGFAAYEVGTIRTTTSSSILKKNLGDASISLCAWVLMGYAIASGEDKGHASGGSYWALTGKPFEATEENEDTGSLFLKFVFQWSFAATCTTIVSGAVADRIYVGAYFIYAFLTSAVFYPLLAHAVWADEGWASPLKTSQGRSDAFINCGVVDFAGSGVVHMLGGGISFVLAIMVKNRPDRFIEANEAEATQPSKALVFFKAFQRRQARADEPPSDIKNLTDVPQLNEYWFRPNDPSWMTLGCFLLWIGWYGFNCGSSIQISTEGKRHAAGRAAINTTIGAAVGSISSMIVEMIYHLCSPTYRRGDRINDPLEFDGMENKKNYQQEPGFRWHLSTHKDIHVAACNGVLAGLVGITAGGVDDAVNAAAVHLFGGFWGLIAAGFTVNNAARVDLGYPTEDDDCTWENQARANFAMAGIIMLYSFVCGGILWVLFKFSGIAEKARKDNQLKKRMDPEIKELNDRLDRHIDEAAQLFGKLENFGVEEGKVK